MEAERMARQSQQDKGNSRLSPGQDLEQPAGEPHVNDLAQSVVMRLRRMQLAVSPWVQRFLDVESQTQHPAGSGPRVQRQMALTAAPVREQVARVQSVGTSSMVWKPRLDRLPVIAMERYAGSVLNRFAMVAPKYESHPMKVDAALGTTQPSARLALGVPGDLGESAPSSAAAPEPPLPSEVTGETKVPAQASTWYKKSPSFEQLEQAFLRAADRSSAPPVQVQRATEEPWRSAEIPIVQRERRRVRSRIEEFTPAAGTSGDVAQAPGPELVPDLRRVRVGEPLGKTPAAEPEQESTPPDLEETEKSRPSAPSPPFTTGLASPEPRVAPKRTIPSTSQVQRQVTPVSSTPLERPAQERRPVEATAPLPGLLPEARVETAEADVQRQAGEETAESKQPLPGGRSLPEEARREPEVVQATMPLVQRRVEAPLPTSPAKARVETEPPVSAVPSAESHRVQAPVVQPLSVQRKMGEALSQAQAPSVVEPSTSPVATGVESHPMQPPAAPPPIAQHREETPQSPPPAEPRPASEPPVSPVSSAAELPLAQPPIIHRLVEEARLETEQATPVRPSAAESVSAQVPEPSIVQRREAPPQPAPTMESRAETEPPISISPVSSAAELPLAQPPIVHRLVEEARPKTEQVTLAAPSALESSPAQAPTEPPLVVQRREAPPRPAPTMESRPTTEPPTVELPLSQPVTGQPPAVQRREAPPRPAPTMESRPATEPPVVELPLSQPVTGQPPAVQRREELSRPAPTIKQRPATEPPTVELPLSQPVIGQPPAIQRREEPSRPAPTMESRAETEPRIPPTPPAAELPLSQPVPGQPPAVQRREETPRPAPTIESRPATESRAPTTPPALESLPTVQRREEGERPRLSTETPPVVELPATAAPSVSQAPSAPPFIGQTVQRQKKVPPPIEARPLSESLAPAVPVREIPPAPTAATPGELPLAQPPVVRPPVVQRRAGEVPLQSAAPIAEPPSTPSPERPPAVERQVGPVGVVPPLEKPAARLPVVQRRAEPETALKPAGEIPPQVRAGREEPTAPRPVVKPTHRPMQKFVTPSTAATPEAVAVVTQPLPSDVITAPAVKRQVELAPPQLGPQQLQMKPTVLPVVKPLLPKLAPVVQRTSAREAPVSQVEAVRLPEEGPTTTVGELGPHARGATPLPASRSIHEMAAALQAYVQAKSYAPSAATAEQASLPEAVPVTEHAVAAPAIMPLYNPVVAAQRAAQAAARTTESRSPYEQVMPPPASNLPLATPPTVVQRAQEVVPRVGETPPITQSYTASTALQTQATEPAKPTVDLDQLARQIYPILKRMLRVETERRASR